MSALDRAAGLVRPITGGSSARAAHQSGTRSRLRLAPAPVGRPSRGPFAILVAALLGLGLLSLLMLNTVLSQDAFVLHDLQSRASALTDREQALQREVAAEAAPEKLAARAAALGMVPSENPVFLRLSDGKVLGVPAPAKAPPKPKPKPKPAATPAVGAGAKPPAAKPPAAKPPAATPIKPIKPTPAAQTGAAR